MEKSNNINKILKGSQPIFKMAAHKTDRTVEIEICKKN